MKTLKLRIIYTLHMTLPLALVALHVERLDETTVQRLRSLFGGS